MKNILVIGAAGQIGSELVPELRRRGYMTVAAGSGRTPLPAHLIDGPTATVNLLDRDALDATIKHFNIDTVFNLAAILSAVGESKPMAAWDLGVNGVIGLLELARDRKLSVFTPSSIGVFGPETPHNPTPQDTVCRPRTMYGITKVAGELLSDYYRAKYGVDARSVRYPGLISYVTPPGGGTTDYAVDIYWKAVESGVYRCPLKAGTYLPMMFMPDALRAAIDLMEADASRLKHFNSFNVGALSFAPEDVAASIQKRLPDFKLEYDINPLLQGIAESWPDALDDTAAREEWDWEPEYSLDAMTDVMLTAISERLGKAL
ncbi:MAG: NAD-dependent epimerase/dehydratase family protein [Sutterella wadsworthensis]|nr:NAD-dependent epimerase/dehydratase family protein [Sutterella wadsworthensis]